MPSGGKRKGAGRPPFPPHERQTHATIRLTLGQIEQLKRIGNGNLSAGIRKLLDRYVTLISLWQHNVTVAHNALATAKHFDAPLDDFEAMVVEAEINLHQFQTEYDLVTNIVPSE